ncbi:MAG: ABC transporter substrate-binding protein [Oceanicaulis sp.]|uniref:MlaC/ttg2D family ABC transporter substrate-binding protein n=1 Tax=Glycocaulis sp. TaxID=1969725 RepID=UPI0025C01532|nr:ABC transporter substrate-binding protein [Glycocaulis sp.]MCC5981037.1 ABC transporter substrate-binding protein [Oceanicaulis sp.]MCH8522630.1 ABC transporter substrate-binding protein [Glycocaulis sp.]
MLNRLLAALPAPALFLGLVFFALSPAAEASDARAAEAFVEREAQRVIDALQAWREGEVDLDTLRRDFRDRVDDLADVERITGFVLGRYRRGADPQALEEFSEVFREFAIQVYERELGNYAGQTLSVTGSVTRNSGDYVVRSVVRGGNGEPDVPVNWRVLVRDNGMKVVDAEVMGVWLAQTQREQITGIIGNARGDISAATRVLRERIERNNSR